MQTSDRDPAHAGRGWALLNRATKALAMGGGLVFVALIVISLVSIIGRKLGFGSITGDVEIMQTGTAVAAAAFLPYCTLVGDHLRVDIFTEWLPARVRQVMDGICELILGAVILLLAWRTGLSALHLRDAGDTTTLLGWPIWIPVAIMVPCLLLTVLSTAWRVQAALGWAQYRSRQEQMAVDQGVSA
ncbi:TRAP transporter small permease [Castellaniella sp. MT123]|uniref:TRAP transporter small permease n=1 Tax=Castellaniella sp. MT123 TaxID=3140381 RepID=UPI0031F3A82B